MWEIPACLVSEYTIKYTAVNMHTRKPDIKCCNMPHKRGSLQ